MVPRVSLSFARAGLLGGALLANTAGHGCARDPDSGTRPTLASASSPILSLASPTAFDLTSSPSGAVLGWAGADPGSLYVARFDGDGSRLGEPLSTPGVVLGNVRDLAISDALGGAALIWVEAAERTATARAAWLTSAGIGRAFELGPAFHGAPEVRGNVAVTARGQGALALVRGAGGSCADDPLQACFEFGFFRMAADGASATGIALTVPVPCEGQAAQLISTPDASAAGSPGVPASPASSGVLAEPRFDYAVCTLSGAEPVLTVFGIQPEREYAAAEQVFEGCTPLGAGRFAGSASFVAACGNDRRMVAAGEGDARMSQRVLNQRGLICDAAGARLKFGQGWLRLVEPMSKLELLLDADLAPPGSSVVWTGRALLVARAEGKTLAVSRYACAGSQLRQLDAPLGARS